MEGPEEDMEILEEALKLYKQSKKSKQKRRAPAPGSKFQLHWPIDAGSPQPVGFTIEDSVPVAERHREVAEGVAEETLNTPCDGIAKGENSNKEWKQWEQEE